MLSMAPYRGPQITCATWRAHWKDRLLCSILDLLSLNLCLLDLRIFIFNKLPPVIITEASNQCQRCWKLRRFCAVHLFSPLMIRFANQKEASPGCWWCQLLSGVHSPLLFISTQCCRFCAIRVYNQTRRPELEEEKCVKNFRNRSHFIALILRRKYKKKKKSRCILMRNQVWMLQSSFRMRAATNLLPLERVFFWVNGKFVVSASFVSVLSSHTAHIYSEWLA